MFLPLFNPNLDFLQAVKVTKSDHHLLHDRASKGYGSIPGWTSQTDLHVYKDLRGPAPKKRPMISGSKIESADFYLPSRGY